jgi:peptidoglycan hydrolase-like protein with peptidoglycan-binding domain
MSKTNVGLVEFAKSKVGCGYVYGATGQVITEALIQQFASWNPIQYSSEYIVRSRKWIGRESYDCAGIIDAYCGINTTANNYFLRAAIKGTSMINFPKTLGALVHMNGHVGIYIGNGQVVEARGVDYGVVITALSARPWVRWSLCYLVDYISIEVTPPPIVVVSPVPAPIPTRPVNPYAVPTITLYLGKYGMTRDQVKWLQFELNWRYGGVSVDGSFGPITKTSLGVFQKHIGWIPDYNCGPLTREKLKTTLK